MYISCRSRPNIHCTLTDSVVVDVDEFSESGNIRVRMITSHLLSGPEFAHNVEAAKFTVTGFDLMAESIER